MNLLVVNEKGKRQESGRDLTTLRQSMGEQLTDRFNEIRDERYHRDDITRWDAELKPQSIARHRALYEIDLVGLSEDDVTL